MAKDENYKCVTSRLHLSSTWQAASAGADGSQNKLTNPTTIHRWGNIFAYCFMMLTFCIFNQPACKHTTHFQTKTGHPFLICWGSP